MDRSPIQFSVLFIDSTGFQQVRQLRQLERPFDRRHGATAGRTNINGHSSHQISLDVDIWFKPMPDHALSREERETDPAVNVVAPDGLDVDHKVWTSAYTEVVKTAAEERP